jgi:hypothetical protein
MKPHPECGLCMMKWVYERVGNSLGVRDPGLRPSLQKQSIAIP